MGKPLIQEWVLLLCQPLSAHCFLCTFCRPCYNNCMAGVCTQISRHINGCYSGRTHLYKHRVLLSLAIYRALCFYCLYIITGSKVGASAHSVASKIFSLVSSYMLSSICHIHYYGDLPAKSCRSQFNKKKNCHFKGRIKKARFLL